MRSRPLADLADAVPGAGLSLAEPQTGGCTPTTAALEFDGGYKVSMCYVTPDGTVGQAKSGIWASSQSGLLWFFDRGNAEVLVKVLNGCSNNGYRWVFVAPVTTLEFNLRVTGPLGENWTHSNHQGETAATKSDVQAFSCAGAPAAGLDFSLDAENADPNGITYARGFFYVADWEDDKVYAYDGTGKRVASRDFALDAENADPTGIVYAGGFFYVTDNADDKAYAYCGSGGRCSSRDFSLGPRTGNGQGIAYGGGFFWVVDYEDRKVYAYDRARVREPSRDFDLSGYRRRPFGIAYAGRFLHVVVRNHRSYESDYVWAYDGTGNYAASRDIRLDSANYSPSGITYVDGFFYVVDWDADSVFAYPEPEN